MNRLALLTLAAVTLPVQAASPARTDAPARPATPAEIVAAAPAADWTAIPPADLLVMTLAPDAAGRPRRVTIQLIGAPFARGWVDNIRALARAHWWDGTSVNRIQDNYVAQWGDASEKKPLPPGLAVVPAARYVARNVAGRRFVAFGAGDSIAAGFPIRTEAGTSWPIHCYGMVGVGRNLSPDTGSGAELYAVIGQAPRHLDRNVAVVGRVIEGIEHLSSLPRGTEPLGFYKTAAERTPIASIRLASDLPAAAPRPRFEYLATGSAAFARYVAARANRRDDFFIRPAGWVDVCNAPVPVRRASGG